MIETGPHQELAPDHPTAIRYPQAIEGWTPSHHIHPGRRILGEVARHCRQTLRAHRLFILLVLALAAMALGLNLTTSSKIELTFSLYHRYLYLSLGLLVALFLIYRTFMMMLIIRPRHPLAYLISDIRSHHLSVEKLTRASLLLVLFPLFTSAFTYCKTMIPILHPFAWDPFWVSLDRLLHFGIDPWRLLHPWLGYAPITRGINVLYNLWMFFWFIYLIYLFLSTDKERLRMRFLISFILTWITLGVLLATIFSSAGPCFFDRLYPEIPYYDELMAYLQTANKATPIWAVSTQNMLWEKHQEIAIGVGSGISAMPSMHVAITFLITLTQLQINRPIGFLFLAYTLVILVGSVHLAWHYAVDGYVSLIVTFIIWWGVGKCLSGQASKNKNAERNPVTCAT
jgi:hypothetical protein